MAFHFSLDAVLRLRRGQERIERVKLEAILSERAKIRARLEDVTQCHFELRRQFQQELAGVLVGSELHFEAMREAKLASLRAALQARLAELDQQRWAQTQIFLKARQAREILENLRLRKLHLYRIKQGRREQQDLDDLFLMRQATSRDE